MCHTIENRGGIFLLDTSREERAYLVGKRQFRVRQGEGLFPLFYRSLDPYKVERENDAWVLTHSGIGGTQYVSACMEILCPGDEFPTPYNHTLDNIQSGIHVAPFGSIEGDQPTLLYSGMGADGLSLMLPVWFDQSDIMFYDGLTVSVKKLYVFEELGDLPLPKKWQEKLDFFVEIITKW